MGHRHHRAPDPRGQGLLRRRARRLLAGGWSAGRSTRRQTAALVTNALGMAIEQRDPTGPSSTRTRAPSSRPGRSHRRALDSGLMPSMGSVGDCFDNAVIESFWSRMQVELLDRALADPGRARQRDLRVPRDLPQPPAPPLGAWHANTDRVRSNSSTPPRQPRESSQRDSTKPRAPQSLHQTRGDSARRLRIAR